MAQVANSPQLETSGTGASVRPASGLPLASVKLILDTYSVASPHPKKSTVSQRPNAETLITPGTPKVTGTRKASRIDHDDISHPRWTAAVRAHVSRVQREPSAK